MPKTITDPNPHISILDDAPTKKQVADNIGRALALADKLKRAHPLSEEQLERERFQAASNEAAEANPLYAAARSASNHFLVVPLHGTDPLVRPADATRDAWQLFNWWSTWPEANPGILLGRAGGVFAIKVHDAAAWERFRDMAAVERYDADTDKRWTEYREIGGATVRLVKPSSGRRIARTRTAWGREFDRLLADLRQESRPPEGLWLLYSYPSVVSGLDAFDYRTKTIAEGVKVFGDHATMPYSGAILEDGTRVGASFSGRPPEPPMWLAKRIGNPRSRKVMLAAREAYEADLRVTEAHVLGEAEARRASTEAARGLALADHERATKALEEG
jgi:hypothetical protein